MIANSALLWTAAFPHSPDEDDDRGRLSHSPNHAAHTDDTQEGEEGLLAAWAGTLPWESHGVLAAAGHARAASQVLEPHRKVVISSRSVSGSERVSICAFWTHCFGAASEAGRQVGDSVGAAHGTHGRRLTVTVADAHGLRLLPGLQCPTDGDKAQGGDGPAT